VATNAHSVGNTYTGHGDQHYVWALWRWKDFTLLVLQFHFSLAVFGTSYSHIFV